MYYSASVLAAVLSDEDTARRALPAIEADRKRLTSSVAAVEAILALSGPADGEAPSRTPAEASALLVAFLERQEIEIRDLPPPSRTVAMAAEGTAADAPGTLTVLDAVCAAYYEVPAFDLDAALCAPPAPEDDGPGDDGSDADGSDMA